MMEFDRVIIVELRKLGKFSPWKFQNGKIQITYLAQSSFPYIQAQELKPFQVAPFSQYLASHQIKQEPGKIIQTGGKKTVEITSFWSSQPARRIIFPGSYFICDS